MYCYNKQQQMAIKGKIATGPKPQMPKTPQVNVDFMKIWNTVDQYIPQILKDPIRLASKILKYTNFLFTFILCLLLIGQTIHILQGSERKYINLRHILIKWLSLVFIFCMADYVKTHTEYDELFVLMCNFVALTMVYPSKFIKNLHLKYFSFGERKKDQSSVDQIVQLEMSLTTRILQSITIYCLNFSRFLITFIPPLHRKKIQIAMKGVNMVIVDEKYFWSMYQTTGKSSTTMNSQYRSASLLNSSGVQNNRDYKALKQSSSWLPKSTKSLNDPILKAKVAEYIQMPISTIGGSEERKFAFYRQIEMNYNLMTCQLTISNIEDGKITSHVLEEVNQEPNLMLKLVLQGEDEPIFVKFKFRKQYDNFINALYVEDTQGQKNE